MRPHGEAVPDFTIAGDPSALRAMAATLVAAAGASEETGRDTDGFALGGWQGSAAEAFRSRQHFLAACWFDGGTAARVVGSALRQLADDVEHARTAAIRADDQWQAGQQLTAEAEARRADASAHSQAASAGTVVVVPPRTDPGAGACATAAAQVRAARAAVAVAGAAAADVIRAAAALAPSRPSLVAPSRPHIDLNDGSNTGGVTPGLPTDSASLLRLRLLDLARIAGMNPKAYADVLREYWAARAAQAAGIDLATWDPALGVSGNRATIEAVYTYYGRLFLAHRELHWAGMANLMGPAFAGGFLDLRAVGELADRLGGPAADLPAPLRSVLPPGLAGIAELSHLSEAELRYYEHTLLSMQKQIFVDQGAMHEAYLAGGLPALNEMQDAGVIDSNAMTGWTQIDEGARGHDPGLVVAGNRALLRREQMQVIPDEYDDMRHHVSSGPAFTYAMTVIGAPTIPGAHTPAQFSPVNVHADIPVGWPVSVAHVDTVVTAPLPDFDISYREERWLMIRADTLQAYEHLLATDPSLVRALVSSEVGPRIEAARPSHQIDQILDRLSRWHASVTVRPG